MLQNTQLYLKQREGRTGQPLSVFSVHEPSTTARIHNAGLLEEDSGLEWLFSDLHPCTKALPLQTEATGSLFIPPVKENTAAFLNHFLEIPAKKKFESKTDRFRPKNI